MLFSQPDWLQIFGLTIDGLLRGQFLAFSGPVQGVHPNLVFRCCAVGKLLDELRTSIVSLLTVLALSHRRQSDTSISEIRILYFTSRPLGAGKEAITEIVAPTPLFPVHVGQVKLLLVAARAQAIDTFAAEHSFSARCLPSQTTRFGNLIATDLIGVWNDAIARQSNPFPVRAIQRLKRVTILEIPSASAALWQPAGVGP
mmetsp:Transcript_64912/g.174052  ORF Transcript_64912/g.174052 Transcript_64912/m.174052 type:complete len:200 (+) Transcript_64912:519-1118(+)